MTNLFEKYYVFEDASGLIFISNSNKNVPSESINLYVSSSMSEAERFMNQLILLRKS